MLIGTHVPFEIAVRAPDREALCTWYERACDEGVVQAGLVLARLVLVEDTGCHEAPLRSKAWRALERAAEAGIAEAQWLLSQQLERKSAIACADCASDCSGTEHCSCEQQYLEWARRAACNGVIAAQRRMADHAWVTSDDARFLHWALPVARAVVHDALQPGTSDYRLATADMILLSRCAQVLFRTRDFSENTIEKLAEPAARAGDRRAQFCLGLWFSKMDEQGRRVGGIPRQINYRMAIQWLTLAGQQGISEAWYVVSRIYLKAEFAQRSIAEAERYLAYAAHAGHCEAQLELGKRLWRKRRHAVSSDVDAVYWLQRASAQGCTEAEQLLHKMAPPAIPAPWAQTILREHLFIDEPLLEARIKLAARFGLSKHEALLLDLEDADRGHCLLVDIRDYDIRAKRHVILIQSGEERRALDRIKRVFERETSEPYGQERSYRQRLYRLESALMSQSPRKSGNDSGRDKRYGRAEYRS